eukprot:5559878-Ditylum_brightwellii.AAC.1
MESKMTFGSILPVVEVAVVLFLEVVEEDRGGSDTMVPPLPTVPPPPPLPPRGVDLDGILASLFSWTLLCPSSKDHHTQYGSR